MILNKTLPQFYYQSFQENKKAPALLYKEGQKQFAIMTYQEMLEKWNFISIALHKMFNITNQSKVFILSDNRPEWIICDLAIISLRAIDVPRGSEASDSELEHIINHLSPDLIIADTESAWERLNKMNLINANSVILNDLSENFKKEQHSHKIYSFNDLLQEGKSLSVQNPSFLEKAVQLGNINDVITIIYTSGTSSSPKGVCLSHLTFTFQLYHLEIRAQQFKKGSRAISILPVWHVYERIGEYFILYRTGSIVYSKPTSKILLQDIKLTNPIMFFAVPRIFEVMYKNILKEINKMSLLKKGLFKFFYGISFIYNEALDFTEHRYFIKRRIYPFFKYLLNLLFSLIIVLLYPIQKIGFLLVFNNIRKKFGKNLKFALSGGAHLPIKVNKFFRDIKLNLIEGYGMTEMGPVIAVRQTNNNIQGSTGRLLDGVEHYFIDLNGNKNEQSGVLYVKSPQMMSGYYNNPEATQEAITPEGFLNTGDIGQMDHRGRLRITGRVKNIVVLANGENIETEPIESALNLSPYIEHSCVVGQDEKNLGVLIAPNFEYLISTLNKQDIYITDHQEIINNPEARNIYKDIIKTLINSDKIFKKNPIVCYKILEKEFEINKELTPTLKIKRYYIERYYQNEIYLLFHEEDSLITKTIQKVIHDNTRNSM